MITLFVKVKPGAGRDEIKVEADGSLTVKIREKPIEGKANEYLVKYLADVFNLSRGKINLEKGATSRFKKISIDVNEAEWEKIILQLRS